MDEKILGLSVKVLIRDAEGRVLLLRRAPRCQGNPGKWDLPGGKVEPGEDIAAAVAREIAEECGLAVSIEHVAGTAHSESRSHVIVYVFLEARLASGEVRLSDEHDQLAWVRRAELTSRDVCPQFRGVLDRWGQSGD